MFITSPLMGDDSKRFVGHEKTTDYFATSVSLNKTCGIIGKPGWGKTSFLYNLKAELDSSSYGKYIDFRLPLENPGQSGLYFLREVLKAIQGIGSENRDLFGSSEDFKGIERNIRGLNSLISTTDSTDPGVYTNEERLLKEAVLKLLEPLEEIIFLYIDGLDKVGHPPLEHEEWQAQILNILKLGRQIALPEKLNLVYALPDMYYRRFRKALKNPEKTTFTHLLDHVNCFARLERFSLRFATKAVKRSLKHAGYKGNVSDLFAEGVLAVLLRMVEENPRRFMQNLDELINIAYENRQHQISLDMVKSYLFEKYDSLTVEQWEYFVKRAFWQ